MNFTYNAFRKVLSTTLGFRECAEIISIAKQTDTLITVTVGNKQGTTNSILSLATLGLIKDTSVVFTVSGENQQEAFHKLNDLAKNGWNFKEEFITD